MTFPTLDAGSMVGVETSRLRVIAVIAEHRQCGFEHEGRIARHVGVVVPIFRATGVMTKDGPIPRQPQVKVVILAGRQMLPDPPARSIAARRYITVPCMPMQSSRRKWAKACFGTGVFTARVRSAVGA